MRKVVVNSTPIIALSKVGCLSILRDMYGEIIIPEAVFNEVTAKNDNVKDAITKAREWIHIETLPHNIDRSMYKAKLHTGEVEVMLLAQRIQADLVIIDDGASRKAAEYLGLNLTGTVGVLIKAQQKGYINNIKGILNKMDVEGIYFSQRLKELVDKLLL